MTTHSFSRSLAFSRQHSNAGWWLEIYREAFPTMRSAVSVRDDGWAQRGGIDRVITLSCGRTIKIDEKVREKDWPDILLEQWSDDLRRIPGWVQKPLACDFIAYAFLPSRTCYLLPVLMLQRAWTKYKENWICLYGTCRAKNNGYVTVSVPVPIDVLFESISDAMRIQWDASNEI